MDTRHTKTVKWLLELLNTNLKELTELDYKKLVLDARYHLIDQWPDFPYIPIGKGIQTSSGDFRGLTYSANYPEDYQWMKVLLDIQTEIRKAIDDLWASYDAVYGGIILKDDYVYMVKNGKEIPSTSVFDIADVKLVYNLQSSGNDIKMAFCLPEVDLTSLNRFCPEDLLVKITRMMFIVSLHGLPNNCIHKCEDEKCGRYFLHTSKKPKRFCSNKCASRVQTRERREKEKKVKAKSRESGEDDGKE